MLGNVIGGSIERGILWGRSKLPKMLGGISNKEYVQQVQAVDQKYAQSASSLAEVSNNIKNDTQSASKALTNWSFADKMSSPATTNINKNRDTYLQAVANSKGNQEAAKNSFIKGGGSAEEFANQAREQAYRQSNPSSVINNSGMATTLGTAAVAGASITNGTGGNYNGLPMSRGDGWQANKDLILAASRMTGVDPVLMAEIATIESSSVVRA
jgi:hypothetical protein